MSQTEVAVERMFHSSPRAGGDEPIICTHVLPPKMVVPAQAGMSPTFCPYISVDHCSPRAGGDEPCTPENNPNGNM